MDRVTSRCGARKSGVIPSSGAITVDLSGETLPLTFMLDVAPASGSIQLSMSATGAKPFQPEYTISAASQMITIADTSVASVVFTAPANTIWSIL